MNIVIPKFLRELTEIFPCELYLVGGYVRNSIMGIPTDDIDICSALTLDEVENLLKGSKFQLKIRNKMLGSAYICCDECKLEYTTFRQDFYGEGGGHCPEKVIFIKTVSEDAKRRDFTCNALYYDIKNDRLLDFYDGVNDIRHRILRTIQTPDEVLSHDGIRILRMFRFEAELNFKIDRTTLASAVKHMSNIRDVSGERVINELTKILHSPRYKGVSKPNAFMRVLKQFNKTGVWDTLGIGCSKVKYRMVKKAEHRSQGLMIDIIDSVNPISISYYLNLVLNGTFGMNKKMLEQYINIISGYYEALNRMQNKPYFFKYFNNFPTIYLLLVHKNRYLASKYQFFFKYIISHKIVVSVKELKISGEDIKKHYPTVKSIRYNAILESLLSDIFDGNLVNEKDELIKAIEPKLKYL